MRTFNTKLGDIKRKWFLVDADGKVLGRLATEIAKHLRGKYKVEYTPHLDAGDYIVVINAEKVTVTGKKFRDKIYHHHTGYIGGLKSISFKDLMKKHPDSIIRRAVKGMLPKNSLGRSIYKKLKVYSGESHPHEAQKPQILKM